MPRRRPAALPTRWAALASAAAGLLAMLAFPPYGWWPLAFVSVAALTIAVDGKRPRTAAWLGYLYGAAFLVPLLHWTGIYVGPVPWLILALAFAAFFAFLGVCVAMLLRLPLGVGWVAAGWVLAEALRDRMPFGGFPWGRLAFSQAQSPLRWFAAVGGAPLVTFAVALSGTALAVAAGALLPVGAPRTAASYAAAGGTRRAGPRRAVAGALAVVVAVPVVGLLVGLVLDSGNAGRRTITVAVIQGGLPSRGLAFEDRAEQVLDNHIAQTTALAAQVRAGTRPKPDLVLWPENASDVDPFIDAAAYKKIDDAVRAIDAPVLVGAILQGPGANHRRNVGVLWSPRTGPGATYTKRHPVPFAEYIPLRGLSEWVSADAKSVTQDMVAGTGDGLLTGGPVPIGDVICFEVAYDQLVRSSVSAGAGMVVVQTNNATFGHTPETFQQLAMSQLRAVESGRTVVQVATTGKSAIIGPDGNIRARSGALFTASTLEERVAIRAAQTPATRLAEVPEWVLAGLAVVGLLWVIFDGLASWRRTKRKADSDTPIVAEEEMVNT